MPGRRARGDGTIFYHEGKGVWIACLPAPATVARSGRLERTAPTQREARQKLA